MTGWTERWRADGFPLSVEQQTDGPGPLLHRVVMGEGASGAATLCLEDDSADARLLMVRVHRPSVGLTLWEFPRGMSDPDDASPEATGVREVEEETGVHSHPLAHLGVIYPDTGILATQVHIVLAVAEPGPAGEPDGEAREAAWFTREEIDAMIRDGLVADGISLAALRLADSPSPSAPIHRGQQ